LKVVLHPEADAELSQGVDYYASIDQELGERFLGEIKRLIAEISMHPRTFRKFDPPARRHFSTWFPYGVIYLEQPDQLWIVAIMHMKRRPGYWKPRAKGE
jgi:plasmid stabilization system protein ParE